MESKSAAFLHIFPMLTLMRPLFVASEKKLRFASLIWVFMVLYAFEMKYFLKYRSECENWISKCFFQFWDFFALWYHSHHLSQWCYSYHHIFWKTFQKTPSNYYGMISLKLPFTGNIFWCSLPLLRYFEDIAVTCA